MQHKPAPSENRKYTENHVQCPWWISFDKKRRNRNFTCIRICFNLHAHICIFITWFQRAAYEIPSFRSKKSPTPPPPKYVVLVVKACALSVCLWLHGTSCKTTSFEICMISRDFYCKTRPKLLILCFLIFNFLFKSFILIVLIYFRKALMQNFLTIYRSFFFWHSHVYIRSVREWYFWIGL